MNIIELLAREEGFSKTAYCCTAGYPTIGIGWKIGRHNQSLNDFENMVISRPAAEAQLQYEVFCIEVGLFKHNWFVDLNEPRQAVITSMAYQMGLTGLYKFKRMIAAIKIGDWDGATHEGLDSRWATQTPERADRQMNTLLCGDWSWYKV